MSALEQVRAAVAAYDAALRADDLDAVDSWFVVSEETSRFGVSGVDYGSSAIAAGRRDPASASPPPVDRVDGRHELRPLGDDVVVATLEHLRPGDPRRRRRTQVWWQVAPGQWRIAHAHLSVEP
jgi:ketosteroid isomerase-like protein